MTTDSAPYTPAQAKTIALVATMLAEWARQKGEWALVVEYLTLAREFGGKDD